MKKGMLITCILLIVFSCNRNFDPPGVDDILIDQYEGIKTIPDPTLTGISVTNDGGSAFFLAPSFSKMVTNYQTTVAAGVASVRIMGTTTHPGATVNFRGASLASGVFSSPVALATGTNTLLLHVLAQDGLTPMDYIVSVIRLAGGGSSNNLLASLVTSPSNISGFASGTATYTLNVDNSVTSLDVTPTAADGTASLWVGGVATASGATRSVSLPTVGTNTIIVLVQAEDGSQRQYTIQVVRGGAPPSGLEYLIITEWGNDTTTGPVDFAELRNFGSGNITISSSLRLVLSYDNSLLSLTHWGTNSDPALFTPIGSGVSIAPGEIVLVVESDLSIANITKLRGWGLPETCKIFLSTATTLVGTGDLLSQNRIWLTNNDGNPAWSITPNPVLFASNVGTGTFSVIKTGFDPTTHNTTDTSWWANGSAGGIFRTPGVWP